ncbi:hypothetical protein BT96DRAFT_789954, partial [Gymnopus androsaceus JB14]
ATLATPPSAVIHDSPSPINPFDSFFGYTLSQTPTRESQHDRRLSSFSQSDSDIAPPSYVEPPEYESYQSEPATLAMFLFKFGFLFPPFWIMGACILLTPLSPPTAPESSSLPASWLPEKTPAERQQIISRLRTIEVKWARRCLFALLILIVAVAGIGATVWGIL